MPLEGIHGADVTMAQLVECVPNFSEGRNKEVDKLIIFYLFFFFVFFSRIIFWDFFFKVSN